MVSGGCGRLAGAFRDRYLVLLFIVAFLVVVSSFVFIIIDKTPQAWDQALHMYFSFIYFNLIKSLELGSIVHVSNYYPPFLHLVSIPLYFVFGFHEDTAIATNLFFYLLLVFSIYRVGEYLRDRRTGVIAAVLVSFYPMMIVLQREYMIDVGLTSICIFTIYLFIKSENLKNVKYSAFFGISLGLCELMKWTAFIYLLPAIIMLYARGVLDGMRFCAFCGKPIGERFVSQGLRRFCSDRCVKRFQAAGDGNAGASESTLPSLFIASILAFVSCAWWYLPNLEVVIMRLTHFASTRGELEGDPTYLTLQGWIYYTRALSENMGIVLFLLAVFSIIFLLWKRDRDAPFVLVSVVVPYVVFTVVSNKGGRYIMPIMPILALSTALMLTQLESLSNLSKRLKKIDWGSLEKALLGVVVLVGTLQLLTVTIGVPDLTDKGWIYPSARRPDTSDWKIDEVMETIESNGGSGNLVLVLPDHAYLNGQSLEFYRLKDGYNFRVYNGVYVGYDAVAKNFDKIKFFLVIEPRKHHGSFGGVEARLYQLFYEHEDEFSEAGAFTLPDNTTLFVYMRE